MSQDRNRTTPPAPAKPAGQGQAAALSRSRRQELRRKFLRTVLLTGGVLGAGLSGFLPLVYARKPAPAPARRAGREGFPRLLHQVRPVRAGLPGGGDQAGRPGRRLRRRRALHRRAGAGLRFSPATRCSASWPARPARSPTTSRLSSMAAPRRAARRQADPARQGEGSRADAQPDRAHGRGAPDAARSLPGDQGQGLQGPGARRTPSAARCATCAGRPLEADAHRRPCPTTSRSATCACASARSRAPSPSRRCTRRTARKRKSPVVHEPCVGCGVCEMICPTEPGSIEIVPREVWRT
jgi:ferredoxin-type protein NapG